MRPGRQLLDQVEYLTLDLDKLINLRVDVTLKLGQFVKLVRIMCAAHDVGGQSLRDVGQPVTCVLLQFEQLADLPVNSPCPVQELFGCYMSSPQKKSM